MTDCGDRTVFAPGRRAAKTDNRDSCERRMDKKQSVRRFLKSVLEDICRIMIDLGVGFQLGVGLGKEGNQAGAVGGGTGLDVQAVRLVAAVGVIFWRIGIFGWFHRLTPFWVLNEVAENSMGEKGGIMSGKMWLQ